MKTKLTILLLLIVLLSGCADVAEIKECVDVDPYGFWGGLWHGMILPFAWIGSLFNNDVAIYAVNNSGGWYDFGFILGAGALTSGSSTMRRK